MARIKLQLPGTFIFSTDMDIRISDINYGNHLGNDAFLSMMHEARVRFFRHFGYSEMDLAGAAVIMGDTAIVYKKECFYGDVLQVEVMAGDFGPRSFDLYYRFTIRNKQEVACEAKTGMVCFDYSTRTTVGVPDSFRKLFA
jgi:acyl-CoA thioesterase FadM